MSAFQSVFLLNLFFDGKIVVFIFTGEAWIGLIIKVAACKNQSKCQENAQAEYQICLISFQVSSLPYMIHCVISNLKNDLTFLLYLFMKDPNPELLRDFGGFSCIFTNGLRLFDPVNVKSYI